MYFDRKGVKELCNLNHGDKVVVRHPQQKLWNKQGVVKEQVAPRSYVVEMADGATYRRNRSDLRETKISDPVNVNVGDKCNYLDVNHKITSNDNVQAQQLATTVPTTSSQQTPVKSSSQVTSQVVSGSVNNSPWKSTRFRKPPDRLIEHM